MSYSSIAVCAVDNEFRDRVTACVAQEGEDLNAMPSQIFWNIAVKSDIEQAYAYALEADNPSPGGDPTVITDAMILAAVQAEYAPPNVVMPAEG